MQLMCLSVSERGKREYIHQMMQGMILVWLIEYTDTAQRQLRELAGLLGEFWRYRVGDCRVICRIEDGGLRILVVQVGNRRAVYR